MHTGTITKNGRRRGVAVAASGFFVLGSGWLLSNQVRGSAASEPVAGPSPVVQDAAAQREVAISAAILRHEIRRNSGMAAPSPNPSPSTFYVQNQFFDPAPTLTTGFTFAQPKPAGPIPAVVQKGILKALAPTSIVFVPNVQAATLWSCQVAGAGYVFSLGVIPPTGNEVEVHVRFSVTAGGGEAIDRLVLAGQTWTVAGTVGPPHTALGVCG